MYFGAWDRIWGRFGGERAWCLETLKMYPCKAISRVWGAFKAVLGYGSVLVPRNSRKHPGRSQMARRRCRAGQFRAEMQLSGLPRGHSSCGLKSLKIDVTGTRIANTVPQRSSNQNTDAAVIDTPIWSRELCAVVFTEIFHFE